MELPAAQTGNLAEFIVTNIKSYFEDRFSILLHRSEQQSSLIARLEEKVSLLARQVEEQKCSLDQCLPHQNEVTDTSEPTRDLPCPACPTRMDRRFNLRIHYRGHYRCTEKCRFCFITLDNIQHFRIHFDKCERKKLYDAASEEMAEMKERLDTLTEEADDEFHRRSNGIGRSRKRKPTAKPIKPRKSNRITHDESPSLVQTISGPSHYGEPSQACDEVSTTNATLVTDSLNSAADIELFRTYIPNSKVSEQSLHPSVARNSRFSDTLVPLLQEDANLNIPHRAGFANSFTIDPTKAGSDATSQQAEYSYSDRIQMGKHGEGEIPRRAGYSTSYTIDAGSHSAVQQHVDLANLANSSTPLQNTGFLDSPNVRMLGQFSESGFQHESGTDAWGGDCSHQPGFSQNVPVYQSVRDVVLGNGDTSHYPHRW